MSFNRTYFGFSIRILRILGASYMTRNRNSLCYECSLCRALQFCPYVEGGGQLKTDVAIH